MGTDLAPMTADERAEIARNQRVDADVQIELDRIGLRLRQVALRIREDYGEDADRLDRYADELVLAGASDESRSRLLVKWGQEWRSFGGL